LGGILCTGGNFNLAGLLTGSLSGIATITATLVGAYPVPLPSGCTGAQFAAAVGGGVGLAVQTGSFAAVLSNTVITTPPVTAAALLQLNAAGKTPAAFYLNAATASWIRVPITSYNAGTGQCTVPCSWCGSIGAGSTTVVVAAASASVPAPAMAAPRSDPVPVETDPSAVDGGATSTSSTESSSAAPAATASLAAIVLAAVAVAALNKEL